MSLALEKSATEGVGVIPVRAFQCGIMLEEARQTKLQDDQAGSKKVCNESFESFLLV